MRASLLAVVIGSAQSFSSHHVPLARIHNPAPTSTTQLQASSKPNELFDSPGWPAIEKELDQVPIFAVANEEGQPIKYKIDKGETSYEIPLFYTHVGDALNELEKAKETNPLPGMDINPYPLGGIFKMWATDSAIIVPNKKSIMQAGAPPTVNAMGQQVPLFACMEIAQEGEDGKPFLPLFLDLEDAEKAVEQAVSFDGGKKEDFEIVCLNLPEAVSLLADAKDQTMAFHFCPPDESIKHIRDYLTGA